ncbi:MAG: hypothetical protein ACLR1T_17230 [Evtepia gabavorous]
MAQYLVKRVLGALPVFFGITLLVFFLMNMAPATIADLAGGEDASSAAARAALEANLGLDQPLPVRYVLWLKELLTGGPGPVLPYRSTGPGHDRPAGGPLPDPYGDGGGGRGGDRHSPGGDGRLEAPLPLEPAGRRADSAQLQRPGLFFVCAGYFFFSVVLGWLPAAGMYSAAGGGGLGTCCATWCSRPRWSA